MLISFRCVHAEHSGEAVVSGEEHAGPPPPGSLHHRQTRGILHGAVDRWIRIPEPDQVRNPAKRELPLSYCTCGSVTLCVRVCVCVWPGSRRASTSRGRTSSGRGSCWPKGSLPTLRPPPSPWRPRPSPSSAKPRSSTETTRTPS